MNETIGNQKDPKGNRKYKDTVFHKVFSNKENLLELYNAINNTNYTDTEGLTINTIEDSMYINMKNDVSFLVDCRMNLYEHQSTYNPNMPLRGMFYFSKLYETYVEMNKINIYSSRLQKLPSPRYVVFYNGTQKEPDKMTLRLSEAFENGEGCLECEAIMLNINYGRNRELMEKCKKLQEYSMFVEIVRCHIKKSKMDFETAIMNAVDECIAKNILKDILVKQKAEVVSLILTTFNQELYERDLKQDAFEEGEASGIAKGRIEGENELLKSLVRIKLNKGMSINQIAEELEQKEEVIQKIKSEIADET